MERSGKTNTSTTSLTDTPQRRTRACMACTAVPTKRRCVLPLIRRQMHGTRPHQTTRSRSRHGRVRLTSSRLQANDVQRCFGSPLQERAENEYVFTFRSVSCHGRRPAYRGASRPCGPGRCVMGARSSASMRLLVLLGLTCGVGGTPLAQDRATAPVPDTPASKLIQSISISPLVAFAGGDLRVVVRVQPDIGNRRLQLSVDAPTFYASTERQLDGADGARAHTFNLHELPAGDYEITAVLEGVRGVRSKITRQFKVMGENSDAGQPVERSQPTRGRRGRGGA